MDLNANADAMRTEDLHGVELPFVLVQPERHGVLDPIAIERHVLAHDNLQR